MRGKALFLVAGTAGYVLGARAGRERYEQISAAAGRLWGNPRVQKTVVDLQDRGADAAKQAGALASDKVSAATSSVAGSVRDKISGSGDAEPLGDQHTTRLPTD